MAWGRGRSQDSWPAGDSQIGLLTSSQGSGRCLWGRYSRLGELLGPWGWDHLPSTPVTKRHSYVASLTSHFDGHGLLGADQVDDFLVGAGGDGIAVDPDNLIPYLDTERCDRHGGECQAGGLRPTSRCSQPQKGLSPSKSFNLSSSTVSQPNYPLAAEGHSFQFQDRESKIWAGEKHAVGE